MKNRTSDEMCKAYFTLMNWLKQNEITVKTLDNEALEEFLQTIKQQGIKNQKVPPHIHHQNAAEKATSTIKDHFTTISVGVDKNFPIHLWDRLLPQAENMLNMLRTTNIAPKILAHAYMYGQHIFNKMPSINITLSANPVISSLQNSAL